MDRRKFIKIYALELIVIEETGTQSNMCYVARYVRKKSTEQSEIKEKNKC